MDLSLTEKAADKLRSILKEKNMENGALRVFVVGGGCSGYQYGMTLIKDADQGIEDEDIVICKNDVKVVVDQQSAELLDGAKIDYIEDLMKSGFTIYNPNATKSCACGHSFQTEEGGGHKKPCR